MKMMNDLSDIRSFLQNTAAFYLVQQNHLYRKKTTLWMENLQHTFLWGPGCKHALVTVPSEDQTANWLDVFHHRNYTSIHLCTCTKSAMFMMCLKTFRDLSLSSFTATKFTLPV